MLQRLQFLNRLNITKRHTTLSVLAIYIVGGVLTILVDLLMPTPYHNTIILITPIGTLIFGLTISRIQMIVFNNLADPFNNNHDTTTNCLRKRDMVTT